MTTYQTLAAIGIAFGWTALIYIGVCYLAPMLDPKEQ